MVTQNVPKKFLIKPTEANTPCTSKRRIRRAHRGAGEPGALWRLQGRKAFDDWGWLESQPWKVWLWGWVYGIKFTTLYTLNRAVTTALVGFNMFQPRKMTKISGFHPVAPPLLHPSPHGGIRPRTLKGWCSYLWMPEHPARRELPVGHGTVSSKSGHLGALLLWC